MGCLGVCWGWGWGSWEGEGKDERINLIFIEIY
jgi:hypothetical protein